MARISDEAREKVEEAIDLVNDATNVLDEENVHVDDPALMHAFWNAQEDLRRAHANLMLFFEKTGR